MPAAPGYVVYIRRQPETVVPGKRLGRYVRQDSRSLAYRHVRPAGTMAAPLQSQLWPRLIPILNQGDVEDCTGNALIGALGTTPLFGALAPPQRATLTEGLAIALYSAAEVIDGDGPYPPQDNGSCGLSVCRAAVSAGLLAGYTHCLSLDDVLDALQVGPVIIGIDWYDSFDNPAGANALISITPGAAIRGGHEVVLRGIDVPAQTVFGDNSWGPGWGMAGSFTQSWDTLSELLGNDGDATVPVPLGFPVPVAVPVAGARLVPPGGRPGERLADLALASSMRQWLTAKGLPR